MICSPGLLFADRAPAPCSWSSGRSGPTCSTTILVRSQSAGSHRLLLTRVNAEVVSLVAAILPLVALFQVFDGLSAITAGILRAVGKQFTGALLNLSAYYVVGA